MRETNDTLPVWAQFAVCLGLPAAMAVWLSQGGDSDNLILLKTLVSVIWAVWVTGFGREKTATSMFAGSSLSEILMFWFVESLVMSAWFTIILWQPDEPVQASLWMFGVQFALFFVTMSLFNYFRRKRSTG